MTTLFEQHINPEKLTEARESKGLSMADLARLIDITRQAISTFEKGTKQPAPDTLMRISQVLDFPIHFFTSKSRDVKIESVVFFRSRSGTAKKERVMCKTKALWVATILDTLTEHAEIPEANIPDLMTKDFNDLSPEEIDVIASQTRRHFKLQDGPIKNITMLLENNGIIVSHIHTTSKVDAFSFVSKNRPIIVTDSSYTAARSRFSIAHELGHLIMHQSISEEDLKDKEIFNLIEYQANYFASCFLMPAKTFSQEFFSTKLSALISLKKRWGVSIAAIILRLSNLQLISENQKLYLYKQLAPYRKQEPLDSEMPKEEPVLLKKLLSILESHKLISKKSLFDLLGIPLIDLATIVGHDISEFKDKYENNIIQFPMKC